MTDPAAVAALAKALHELDCGPDGLDYSHTYVVDSPESFAAAILAHPFTPAQRAAIAAELLTPEVLADALVRRLGSDDGLAEFEFADVVSIAIPGGSPSEVATHILAALRDDPAPETRCCAATDPDHHTTFCPTLPYIDRSSLDADVLADVLRTELVNVYPESEPWPLARPDRFALAVSAEYNRRLAANVRVAAPRSEDVASMHHVDAWLDGYRHGEQHCARKARSEDAAAPVGPVRIRSANCRANDHDDCLGMVEQDVPELGITDCLCDCHDDPISGAANVRVADAGLREAALRTALRLYRLEHDDECGCEGCDAYDNATSEYPEDWAALAARSDWPIPVRAALARPVPPALTVERLGAALDNHAHAIGWDRMCTGEDCGARILTALRDAGKEPDHD